MKNVGLLLFVSFVVQVSFGQKSFCGTDRNSKRTKCFEKIDCNQEFLASKGKWSYPVNGIIPVEIHLNTIKNNDVRLIGFVCDTSATVYSVAEGEVVSVVEYDSLFLVIIKNGCHFICYSNLSGVAVKKHSYICSGEKIGNMGLDLDNQYRLDMMLSELKKDLNISEWFAKPSCKNPL